MLFRSRTEFTIRFISDNVFEKIYNELQKEEEIREIMTANDLQRMRNFEIYFDKLDNHFVMK